jgi:cytidylate kinase
MNLNIITIDGPAASGKGTLARKIAAELNYFYLDTGKIYRLIGLEALKNDLDPETDVKEIANLARQLAVNFDMALLQNPELTSDLAGQMASRTSQFQPIREAVLDLQRSLAKNPPQGQKGTVLDGRDCDTRICPDADYKFYITANQKARAERRYHELSAKDENLTFETVYKDMQIRDERDMTRENDPLKPAEDAIIIDTSDMTVDEAFAKIKNTLALSS